MLYCRMQASCSPVSIDPGLMRRMEEVFGDGLDTVEYPGNRHSLLTLHFHEPAYKRVEAYFRARLGA